MNAARELTVAIFCVLVGGVMFGNATPSFAAEPCPNEQLRAEQPYGLGLPDCRAYEMVSPLDKSDNSILFASSRASVSGEAVTYVSAGSFLEPKGALTTSRYLSRRGADGWSTRNISPPYFPVAGWQHGPFEELMFTPELSKGVLRTVFEPLLSGEPKGYPELYVADTENGAYQTVTPIPSPAGAESRYGESFLPTPGGASTDLSHVVFQQKGSLTEEADSLYGASSNFTHVYEWVEGKLSLIDVPPAGVTLGGNDSIGWPSVTGEAYEGDTSHAVSADGSRVVFTGSEESNPGSVGVVGQLYVREVDEGRTVEVSASQKTNGSGPGGTDPDGAKLARYWDASADGSRVFFTSLSELTDNANTGPADNAANLYEYDLEDGVLSDLSVDTNPGDVDGAAVLGLVTASEDGSYVYFVAEGDLAEGAVSGQPNLYLYRAGKVTFIATLAPGTSRDAIGFERGGDSRDWTGSTKYTSEGPVKGPGTHTVRVTPDGVYLAFESQRSLTGYDNEPAEPGECYDPWLSPGSGDTPCNEVYLYDAVTGKLVCGSCDSSGAHPVGPARLGGQEEDSYATPEGTYVPRNLSEDGGRLFFQSPDPLVPHDSNGLRDVYEWEAGGEGSCGQPSGCVFAISDVAGRYESHFMEASPSGNDVFIATGDQFVPSDTDTRVDVYDVRVGGGFPVSVAPPACDNGDSCKPPEAPQPGVFGAPASATFVGAGNPALPSPVAKPKAKKKTVKCTGGKRLSRGRCIKSKRGGRARKAKSSARGRK